MSEDLTITIYQERVPKHYVGDDISIVLKAKCEKWQAALVESAITAILESNNYIVKSDTFPNGVVIESEDR